MSEGISVIVPTLNAKMVLNALVASLRCQATLPFEIIVIDSESTDCTHDIAQELDCEVLSLSRNEFNHGRTRNLAAVHAQSEILVFMTQDALPGGQFFLSNLIEPIISGKAVASYARQIAKPDASKRETYFRSFSYPEQSELRNRESLMKGGVRAAMFSNVASAIRRDVFFQVGMFDEQVIMNEDMLLCTRLLQNGYSVSYAADAVVYHSHSYNLRQIFSRYFDIGVFFSRHMNNCACTNVSSRGISYMLGLFKYLVRDNAWKELFMSVLEIIVKFIGFYFGKLEIYLPILWKTRFSMHKNYWKIS